MGLPHSLVLRQCSLGSADWFPDGLVHQKTVPALILAQCLVGRYEVWNRGRHEVIAPGEWFAVRAMSAVRIGHFHDGKGRMRARWFHLRIERGGGVDAFAGWELPLRIAGVPGRRLSRGWDEVAAVPGDAMPVLSQAILCKVAYGIMATLLPLAERKDESLLLWVERFAPVFTWVEGHIDEPIAVADLAAQMHLSLQHFHAEFKAHSGTTPMAWVQGFRLERAAQLMLGGDDSIQNIAADCGFPNPYHFSRAFKLWSGLPPRTWRREHRDQLL